MTCFAPPLEPIAAPTAAGAGRAAFGNGVAIKYHGDSIQKIKDYEANLHEYAKLVEHDMKGTEKLADLFDQADQLLLEETPFNKAKW